MKDSLLTILRSKKTSVSEFRKTAQKLADLLASETVEELKQKSCSVETPFGKTKGHKIIKQIILIPILRAGMALLPSFLSYFEEAHVAFLGIRRDEKTAKPHLYYEKFPSIKKNQLVFLLDPMIATGGSASLALQILIKNYKVSPEKIKVISIIASKEGINKIKKKFPKVAISVVAVDPKLNAKKFIVPGLGDFGDRFFGTI